MDGTTVSMPDTPANQSVYPQSGVQKPGLGFPVAMLVAVISLATGAVLRWALGPCRGKHTGEQALFRTLMPSLDAGDVILADRYHCNYFTVALLIERDVDLVTRQHQRRITDFRRGKRLGRRDQLVQWQRPQRPSWMDTETYARMPECLTLRQVEVAGRILVTTLTDARSVSASEIDALYSRRWQVEVDLRTIKAEMGMDILRAKSAAMVDKEIAAHLLAYNLVCALRHLWLLEDSTPHPCPHSTRGHVTGEAGRLRAQPHRRFAGASSRQRWARQRTAINAMNTRPTAQ